MHFGKESRISHRFETFVDSWEAPRIMGGLNVLERRRLEVAMGKDSEQPVVKLSLAAIESISDHLHRAAYIAGVAGDEGAAERLGRMAFEASSFVGLQSDNQVDLGAPFPEIEVS